MAIGSVGGIFAAAGGGSFVGGAAIRLALDSAQFQSGLKSSEAKLHAFGRRVSQVGTRMQRVGGGLTRNLTVPIIAAGAASVKVAVDFEQAMTRISSNTNLTAQEVGSLRKHVLELAGQTAKSPQELAEGLYSLASAGLTAQQVQETLTMSARASAAGFGEVGEIARLTANALNAYAKDGLTAAETTDTLAAAIRVGTAEPDEFSNAVGRILPAAQKAGVGFDEVTASLASLSNIGLDVNEGVTAMRGFLLALISPGTQAQETMEEFGLSADMLRQSLEEDGLLATMRLLEESTNGNMDAQRKIIPNIRSLTGLFGITGQKAEQVDKAFRQVVGATGDLDKAFEETKKGPAFQFQQLMAELHTLGIEIGTEMLPVVIDVAHAVRDMVRAFKGLPEGLQDGIIKWGLYAAALGPVLSIMGRILTASSKLTRMKVPVAPAAGGVGGAAAGAAGIGPGSIALLGAANAFLSHGLDEKLKDLQVAAGGAESQMSSFGRRMFLTATGPVGAATAGVKDFRDALDEGKGALGAALDALNPFNDEIAVTGRQTSKLERHVNTLKEALPKLGVNLSDAARFTLEQYIASGNLRGALKLLKDEVDEAADKMEKHRDNVDDAGEASADAAVKVRGLKTSLENLPNRKTIHISAPGLEGVLVGLRAVHTAINNIRNVVVSAPAPPPMQIPGGRRAMGGAVSPRHAYLVGERGPEMLLMGSSGGRVVPNSAMGGDTNIYVSVDARGSSMSEATYIALTKRVMSETSHQMVRRQRARSF